MPTGTPLRTCSAKTSIGTPCKRAPIRGGTVCPFHGGSAPQVKKKAQERLREAAYGAVGVLIEISESKTAPEAARVSAANSILDRSGNGAKQAVEVEVRRYEQLLEGGDLVIDVDEEPDDEDLF